MSDALADASGSASSPELRDPPPAADSAPARPTDDPLRREAARLLALSERERDEEAVYRALKATAESRAAGEELAELDRALLEKL